MLFMDNMRPCSYSPGPIAVLPPRLQGAHPAAEWADMLWGSLVEASTVTAHTALPCLGTVPPT